jgi:hypothetical protein
MMIRRRNALAGSAIFSTKINKTHFSNHLPEPPADKTAPLPNLRGISSKLSIPYDSALAAPSRHETESQPVVRPAKSLVHSPPPACPTLLQPEKNYDTQEK